MYVMAEHHLFYTVVYQFWQHTKQLSGEKKKPNIFQSSKQMLLVWLKLHKWYSNSRR